MLTGDRCSELYNRLPGPGNKGIRTIYRQKQCVCVRERQRDRERQGEISKAADLSLASLCPMELGAVHFLSPLKLFRVGFCRLRNFVFYRFFFLTSTRLFSKNSCLLPRVVGLGENKDDLNHRLRTQHQSRSFSVTVCAKRES